MSNRRPVLVFAISCIVVNVLVWLPGCYLSLVSWFTKFSDNTSLETAFARAAGFTPILGIILSVIAVAVSKSNSVDSKLLRPVHLLFASVSCAAPLLIYVVLKLS